MKRVKIRFYEELNDFLPREKRKQQFEHYFVDRTSVKDLIESLGVPHTEVDLILVNGKSMDFSYLINDKDEISVYPVFESFDITDVQHLRAKPLREPKFVIDVHLGKLARYMRMIGFDAVYQNDYKDEEIVKLSLKEKRIILTKDSEILKRNEVTHGYWVRNEDAEDQLLEIVERFDLRNQIKEFTRCLECNSPLNRVEKEKVVERLPPKIKEWHNDFFECPECRKIYWKGSHFERMENLISRIKKNLYKK
jgi:uncharacterized protein